MYPEREMINVSREAAFLAKEAFCTPDTVLPEAAISGLFIRRDTVFPIVTRQKYTCDEKPAGKGIVLYIPADIALPRTAHTHLPLQSNVSMVTLSLFLATVNVRKLPEKNGMAPAGDACIPAALETIIA
jgi:hypothetical protein